MWPLVEVGFRGGPGNGAPVCYPGDLCGFRDKLFRPTVTPTATAQLLGSRLKTQSDFVSETWVKTDTAESRLVFPTLYLHARATALSYHNYKPCRG